MKQFIDLRSDTVTQPTQAMRRAMYEAEVDDDVYGDDPTINRLENMAAERMGKEAAMFVPSGTMGNQICILTHTQPGDEIITTPYAHIFHYECGAPARLAHVSCAMADHPSQMIEPDDVEKLIRPEGDPHFPHTSLLCVENALCNGDVVPVEQMQALYETAHGHGLHVHLDGARIFNAALALNTSVSALAKYADSVMFCISKGLCAPVGSLVCGSADFIARARRYRKLLGGGMRQAGVLAACGIVALNEMTERLMEDHENAKYLAARINAMPGFTADESRVKINMVFWRAQHPRFSSENFVAFMYDHGVKVYGSLGSEYRYVTHHGIDRKDVDKVMELMALYDAGLHSI